MKMHKNPVWLAFLAVISLVVLWYCGAALYKIYGYSRLTAEVQATSIQWGVKELADDQYIVKANYTFAVEGKIYQGETLFKDIIYMNAWAAEQAGLKNGKKNWKVWFQPNHYNHSTLQKKFPTKECYYAGAMLLLLLYFVGLGFYVTRTKA
jgi:Protein of unknown function (DUF3592)